MHPPAILQPPPRGEPSGSSNPNVYDQEVTHPRGGGLVPPTQPSPSPPQHDQMEGGFLRDHLLNPHGLLQQIQMWGA